MQCVKLRAQTMPQITKTFVGLKLKGDFMKTKLLTIAALTVLATTSFATTMGGIKLQKGDLALYPVQVKLVGVVSKQLGSPCPEGSICIAPAFTRTEAQLEVNVSGCADRLVSTSYNVEPTATGKVRINIAALAVANKLSQSLKCMTQKRFMSVNLDSYININANDIELNDLNADVLEKQ